MIEGLNNTDKIFELLGISENEADEAINEAIASTGVKLYYEVIEPLEVDHKFLAFMAMIAKQSYIITQATKLVVKQNDMIQDLQVQIEKLRGNK